MNSGNKEVLQLEDLGLDSLATAEGQETTADV